ncbi:MAG: VacJ family lipoprotein [Rhodocyclaceae bacterium]
MNRSRFLSHGALRRLLAVVVLTVLVAGCASTPANPDDPLERYNRAMFAVNDAADRAVLRPVARVYKTVTPQPVRTGVGNFFSNLGDVWIGANNFLQGKFEQGFSDLMRVGINTTFGLVGLLDIASEMGFTKNDEDFGQTLAVWGVGDGPYVVLPILGPRTLRDAVATPVDLAADDVWGITHVRTRNSLTGLRLVNTRAGFVGIDRTIERATLDKYAYTRDFYLQQRRHKVYDGNPPIEYEDFDWMDEDDGAN